MMTLLAFMSLSIGEIALLGVVAILVFGGRLPEVMRNLGRAYARFRRGMDDLAHPLRSEMRRIDPREPKPSADGKALPPPAKEPPPGVYDVGEPEEDTPRPTSDVEVGTPRPVVPPEDATRSPGPPTGTAADEPPPV